MSAANRPARNLAQLLPELGVAAAAIHVSDVTLDSREVQPGGLFLACQGRSTHGLRHAPAAIARGARVVLFEPTAGLAAADFPSDIFVAAVPGLAARAGAIADEFFGRPSAQLAVAGITGTNGKTTCAWLLANALRRCGRPSAYMGTLGVGMASEAGVLASATHTTADVVTVHRQLDALRSAGAQCVAMEVSSHALDQGRIDAVRVRVAAFTNLTRDHLDYHGSMAAYGEAKARLFAWPDLAARVINVDDSFGAQLAQHAAQSGRLIVTARQPQGRALAAALGAGGAEALVVDAVEADGAGLRCQLRSASGPHTLRLPLIGEFNVDNALTVLGMLRALDLSLEQAVSALARCHAPPGRMETFGGAAAPLVIVDYAHTPDALAKALQAARSHCSGSLRAVFGCGGDRDRGKRPLMAQAAAATADDLVLTDDNPRTELPGEIVADIIRGLPPGRQFVAVHDRARAIRETLARSGAGDVVLIAGKGHEDYQIYGHEKRPFSDQAVVREALGARA